MRQLKLEVGKTYRNRNGEEVKIVRKDGRGRWPYQGSNGKWYTESGRWDFGTEHPQNLIEEVEEAPETRHTFKIPDGVKEITLDYFGNRIVVEMVPGKEPKAGDVCINDRGSIYILKSAKDSDNHYCYYWMSSKGRFLSGGHTYPGRLATPEEAQPLFDALEKAGKRWNPETMEVEEVPETDRIREWVEKNFVYGYYTHSAVAAVIEAYLKHREGENEA